MDRFDWLELDAQPELGGNGLSEAPSDGESYLKAARAMRASGHFRAAASYYERAVALEEHLYWAWVEWVDTLVRSNHGDVAEWVAAKAVDLYRRVRPLYAANALALCHRGRFEEARYQSDISLDEPEPSWYAQCVRAELSLVADSRGRPGVRGLMERAIDSADEPWEPCFLGGWMFLDAGFAALAAGYFAEAGHYNPHAPIVWLCLGDCFHELRLYEQAVFYYQKVLELESIHDLALKRQRRSKPKLFGLMRLFRKRDLRARWNKEYEKLTERLEPTQHDF
jgi:tetratricopeptide (TPR) repeat protein